VKTTEGALPNAASEDQPASVHKNGIYIWSIVLPRNRVKETHLFGNVVQKTLAHLLKHPSPGA
jgi:hypothetical protein